MRLPRALASFVFRNALFRDIAGWESWCLRRMLCFSSGPGLPWRAAAEKSGIAVILGTERIVEEALLISALVINRDGSTAGFQDKVQLDPSEDGIYSPGASRRIFQAGPLTFGIVICHEGFRYPETVRWAARNGAQIVFHPHFDVATAGSYRPTQFADPANTFHEKGSALSGCREHMLFRDDQLRERRFADHLGCSVP
jgi:hypothetical protein